MKRERMELPDGSKVQCLVLHPVIDTKGMFSKRSDTRIWLTDDAAGCRCRSAASSRSAPSRFA